MNTLNLSEMKQQRENVRTLLELIIINPDLRIIPMVDSEIVADDGHMWWAGSFGKASIEEIWVSNERIYIRSVDEEGLVDEVCNNICDEAEYIRLTDQELETKAKEIISTYKWEKVIAVNIDLP